MPSKSARKAKSRHSAKAQHAVPQPRTLKGKFVSKETPNEQPITESTESLNVNLALVEDLVDDPDTTVNDKLARVMALHARWKYEDTEEQALKGDALKARQQSRCRELGLIVFGLTLHEDQVEAICTLFYEQRDLLLLAKTGFGKSLIFQMIPFMTATTGVVLILMPLKLLQAEQSQTINRIPQAKAIVLNGENSQKSVLAEVARGGYTHVFTSPEIALSKKFKKCILDQHEFTDRLSLIAIDETHLVDEWGKNF